MAVMRFPALVHKDEGSDFGVSFPDFPGCVTAGATAEEAAEQAKEALQFHVDGMLEDGEEIPVPTAISQDFLSDVAAAGDEAPIAMLFVEVRLPARAKRVNVTIDGNLLHDLDLLAAEVGMSRSALLAEGARRLLTEGVTPEYTTPARARAHGRRKTSRDSA